jgi:hypothetical protein
MMGINTGCIRKKSLSPKHVTLGKECTFLKEKLWLPSLARKRMDRSAWLNP